MAIQFSGLASGLDTSALVDQLLTVERRPVALLETRKLKFQAQSTAFQDLNSRLQALRTRADALGDPATLLSRSASSSDEAVAVATAAPGSLRGTFTVAVTQLARGAIAAAGTTVDSFTDTVAAGSGTFSFRLGPGGALVSVALTATTTLEELAADINEASSGVKAGLVNAGTSATPAWKLTLTSVGTGADNDIAIVQDDTALGVTTTQTALDATVAISGLGTFTRSTNSIADVLEGVAITLKGLGTTDVAVDVDRAGTRARVQSLLDAYNDVVRAIDSQSRVTRGSDGTLTPGAFTGDIVPRQLRSTLAAALRTSLAGTVGSLAELGVTTRREDGTLTLDQATFDAALAADPGGVTTLLAGTGARDGLADILSSVVEDATRAVTGSIAARRDGLTSAIRNVDRQIEGALQRLETTERVLRAKFTALERTLAQLQSTGNSLLTELTRLNNQLSNG